MREVIGDTSSERRGGRLGYSSLNAFIIRRHGWIYLLIVAMWCAAAAYVLAQREVALPDPNAKPHKPAAAQLTLSMPPKRVDYQVTSSSGSPVTISYLDDHSQTRRYTGPSPWRMSVTVTDIAAASGMTALSEGSGALNCRISVDGTVVDNQTQVGGSPSVSCNVSALGLPAQ